AAPTCQRRFADCSAAGGGVQRRGMSARRGGGRPGGTRCAGWSRLCSSQRRVRVSPPPPPPPPPARAPPRAGAPPPPPRPDGLPNGLADPATHRADQVAFDHQEEVAEGLGPLYNAHSCRDCHENPVAGGGSQVTELRAGHVDASGKFIFPEVHIGGGSVVVT